MEGFMKNDSDKNMLELVDPRFILGLGEVLTYGAKKYGPNNWKKANGKEDIARIKGAMLRHLMAYLCDEEFDEESGLPHLHHLTAGAMFLRYFDLRVDYDRIRVNTED